MPSISVLMKPSSGMCNMQCDYCFYCDETKKREQESYGFMSEETLKNVIRKTLLRAEGVASYVFQGGEPTLRGIDFFKSYVKYINQYNKREVQIQSAIQTNGLALNEDWCSFLKENSFLVGVSLDGTEDIHNKYRHDKLNKPTYERIKQNIDLLEKYKIEYNILTVVTKEVAQQIETVYNEYKKNGWLFQQYIACIDPLNETRGEQAYALTPKEYGKFLVDLFYLWYEDLKKGKQPYIRQFENYIAILMGYAPEACNQRGSCGIQNVVEADGSVYPCDFYVLDEYKLGNFNNNRLDEINEKRSSIQFIERSYQISEQCRACKYYGICRGGCQRDREKDGETGEYMNYFCDSFQYFFDHCLEDLIEIAMRLKGKQNGRNL